MHAAGEQHMHTLEKLGAGLLPVLVGHPFAVGQQPRDLALPQRKARAWAHVATALASLEDELAGTVGEESAEQTRRGHMQEGVDAGRLQRGRLGRTPTRDQRARRTDGADRLQLGGTDLRRGESEYSNTPRCTGEQSGGLLQQRPGLGPAQQSKGEKRQATTVGHRPGELGPVTDPRHRPLRDRNAQTPVDREGRARGQRGEPRGGGEMLPDRLPDRCDDPAGGDVTISEQGREGSVLADRQELRTQVTGTQPVGDSGRVKIVTIKVGDRQVRTDVDTMPGDDRGLAAVHRPDGGSHIGPRFHLPDQGELDVEHDPVCSAGNRGCGGVRADPTGGPHRAVQLGVQQMLEQCERGQVADPATRLTTPGDQAVRAGLDRRPRLYNRGDLDQDPTATPGGGGHDVPPRPGRAGDRGPVG